MTSTQNPFPTAGSTDTFSSASTPSTAATAATAATGSTASTSGQPDLIKRVAQSAHETIDKLAESASPRVQRMQAGVNDAGTKLHEHADHARELGEEWAESLRTTVRENPLTAVAAAVAIGLLVARLTR